MKGGGVGADDAAGVGVAEAGVAGAGGVGAGWRRGGGDLGGGWKGGGVDARGCVGAGVELGSGCDIRNGGEVSGDVGRCSGERVAGLRRRG